MKNKNHKNISLHKFIDGATESIRFFSFKSLVLVYLFNQAVFPFYTWDD